MTAYTLSMLTHVSTAVPAKEPALLALFHKHKPYRGIINDHIVLNKTKLPLIYDTAASFCFLNALVALIIFVFNPSAHSSLILSYLGFHTAVADSGINKIAAFTKRIVIPVFADYPSKFFIRI